MKSVITEIGRNALSESDKMLLFFDESATEFIREVSVIQRLENEEEITVEQGDIISFGEQKYNVTEVGAVANHNLNEIGHVAFLFGKQQEEFAGGIYLEPNTPPKIEVGMEIFYGEEK
ncbi:PTS system, glucitol/sorbitol-specific IIA component [Pilibacter termitis]|uniref:PTS system, glucitol/sorbitol-specific IIA component n=1 Tax=Pilibacter termitis TaxID=263852 RepID=A0A1T4K3B0_9ENTE|nr:PTS glucitol/sorbitol transporter subunit IIA [Pilibacter termitis]SJZ36906.1 PTS system, glucitol/sorbitol-specific IIA component [Pilibacter termitis]